MKMITLSINGESRALDVDPSTPLLWVIRDYAGLKAKGVVFSAEPRDNGPTTQLAFINAPDGVSVELLCRKDRA